MEKIILIYITLLPLHSLPPSSTSPNTTSAQGCKPATLRWWRSFTTAAQYDSLFSFTVAGNYYRGAILPHEDPLRFERFCSEDEAFCVTHSFGPSIIDVFILFAGREYYHKEPDKIHKYQLGQRDWDVEFWDCVVV